MKAISIIILLMISPIVSAENSSPKFSAVIGCGSNISDDLNFNIRKWFSVPDYLEKPKKELLEKAKNDDGNAYVALAIRVLESEAGNENEVIALGYLGEAISRKIPLAVYVRGVMRRNGKHMAIDVNGAHKDFLDAANLGFPPALTSVAADYLLGRGVSADALQARKFAEKAVMKGDPRGGQILGVIYREGLGVPVDASKSQEYSKKAADAGDVVAAWDVSRNFFFGFGVTKDTSSAYRWAKMSYCGGVEDAGLFVGFELVSNRNDQRKFYAGVDILEDFAEKGDGNACLILSNVYFDSSYESFNPQKGIRLLRCSSRAGNVKVRYQLGAALLRYGKSADEFTESESLLVAEAKNGNIEAQYDLGTAYLRGEELRRDKAAALYWLRQAAANGSVDAENLLEKQK